MGINVSKACESGLAEHVSEAKARQWYEDNKEAIESWNEYVERNGAPLDRYRAF